ncbi:MAG: DNA cytosine methyltransferase [Lentisphaeraceae bacterium]|nr:DNA cytosine methyltransferase [Lentisphaeraceae bacterium]
MTALPEVMRISSAKLGQHKGHSRLYLQGKYLTKAGFVPSEKIKLIISADSIELVVDESGTTTISRKVKNDHIIPVIDILSDVLEDTLGKELEVRVSNQRIVLKPNRIERAKKLREESENTMTCGSIFAGGGLLSQAAKEAGYKEDFCIEIDQRYADVYSDNFPESKVLNQSVHEVNADDIPDVDLLLAGIPCQPFSRARRSGKDYKKGSVPETHELGDMVFWTLRIIDILMNRGKLKAIVIEEAPDFLKSGAGQILLHALKRMKFNVHSTTMDSHEYGSLQSRKRAVIVATTSLYLPPAKSECKGRLGDILERGITHNWFDRSTKEWLYKHWDKCELKGNNFAKGLIKNEDSSHLQAVKRRYFAQQGDSPLVASEDNKKNRWFTLFEVRRLFDLPDDYLFLNVPKTIIGEILGQGVVIGLFKKVIECINRKCEILVDEKSEILLDAKSEMYQPLLF